MNQSELREENSEPVYFGNEVEIEVSMKFRIKIRVEDGQTIEDAIADCPTPTIDIVPGMNNVTECEYIDDSWDVAETLIDGAKADHVTDRRYDEGKNRFL